MNEEALKLLYEDVRTKFQVGSLEDFINYLEDENKRTLFFKEVIKPTYNVENIEEFESAYGLKKKDETIDFAGEAAPTGSSSEEERIESGWSASSVLETPQVDEVTSLNIITPQVEISDEVANLGITQNKADNSQRLLYQQGYYNLSDDEKSRFILAVSNGSTNPLNDLNDARYTSVPIPLEEDNVSLYIANYGIEVLRENLKEDGITLNGVYHAPGTTTYRLVEEILQDRDLARGQTIDINSPTLNYLTPTEIDPMQHESLMTRYGADLSDNQLNRLGMNKNEYLDFVAKTERGEDKGYKFMRFIDNLGLSHLEPVVKKAKKEQEQYERVMLFKKKKLESLLEDVSYLQALQKRTEDPIEYKRLQGEIEKYEQIIQTNFSQMLGLDKYFPNYREHFSKEGTAQVLKRKRLYDAARGNLGDEVLSQGGQVISEGVIGIGTIANGLINYIPEMADEFFSVFGGDDKGLWAGLSQNIRENATIAKAGELGPVDRKLWLKGKPVLYKGEQYRVDENNIVYDRESGVNVQGVIPDKDIQAILTYAKDIPWEDATTELVARAGIPKVVGTLAYMYGLIRGGRKVGTKLTKFGVNPKAAGYMGMGITSYVASVTENVQSIKEDLMKKGFTEEDALERAMIFGHAISTFEGLFAGLAGTNQKLLSGLGGVRQQLMNLMIKDASAFSKAELKRKIGVLLKENLKEVVIEEVPTYLSEKLVNNIMNQYVGSQVRDATVRKEELLDVVTLTVGATTTLGGKSLITRKDRAATMDYLAETFSQEEIVRRLNSLKKEGLLDDAQAQSVFNDIYNMKAANNTTNGTVQMPDNREQMKGLLDQRQKLMEQRKGVEGPLKKDIDKNINAVDKQIDLLSKKDKQQAEQELKNQDQETGKLEVTSQQDRVAALEESLDQKDKEVINLMRKKKMPQEKIDKEILKRAPNTSKGNKLSQQYEAEDIIANPDKYSEALVINAYRHLYGLETPGGGSNKGMPVKSGNAEILTVKDLKEIEKKKKSGLGLTGRERSVMIARDMMTGKRNLDGKLTEEAKKELDKQQTTEQDASKEPSTVEEVSQDESITTEKVVEGVPGKLQQPAGEVETETETETDQTTEKKVRRDFRINDVAGRPISISYTQDGRVVNEEVADMKAARKRINQLKFEDKGYTGPFQSSNPNVELEVVEGEVIATNKKTGAKRKATQKFFNEYMEALEFTGVDSNVETMVNEGEIAAEEAVDFIIENSQNPVEIANELQRTPKTKKGDVESEAAWEAEFRSRSIKESDFDRFGDRNFKTPTMKRRWFEADASGLDQIAEELSSNHNQEITPDMLIEYIRSNPSRKAPARTKTQTNTQRVELGQKFQELTGLKPTARNIRGVAGKEMITQPKSETEREGRDREQADREQAAEVAEEAPTDTEAQDKKAEEQVEEDLGQKPDNESEAAKAPSSIQTISNYMQNKAEAIVDFFKTKTSKIRTQLVDKYRPIRKLQEAIEKATGAKMTYDKSFDMAEDLVYGRMRKKIDDFNTEMFNFFDSLRAKNIDATQLEEYLYAKHAPERNAYIRKITDGENDAGSGMTDTEAQQILDRFEKEGKTKDLEKAAAFIYKKSRGTLDILSDHELMGKTEYDNLLNNEYKYYVPLTGFDQIDVNKSKHTTHGEGAKTLPLRGKEIKSAKGRKTKAASPLANIMKARERAILRSEKNNVLVKLLNMLEANPNNELYNIYTENTPDTIKSINKDGKVVDKALSKKDMLNNLDYIRVVRGGKDYFIKFKDSNMQQSLNLGMPTNVPQVNALIRANAKILQWMRKIYTTLSPAFIVTNYMRDFGTGLMNAIAEVDAPLFSRDMARTIAHISKTSLMMPKVIYAVNMGKTKNKAGKTLSDAELKKKGYDPKLVKAYEEFLEAGGQTGYGYSKPISELKADIDNVSNPTSRKKFIRSLNRLIDAANIAAENSTRVAAFTEARKRGMSIKEAAQLAKNLTINFNRSGSDPVLRGLYLFFNASVQGTVRFGQAMTRLSKSAPGKGNKALSLLGMKDKNLNPAQKMAALFTGFSAMLALLNGFNDEEDEDGVSYYEKVPDYVKTRNMIIMLPNQKGKYIKIPLPYGYNVFHNIGTAMGDAVTGKRTAEEGTYTVGVGLMEAFSPLSFNNSNDMMAFSTNFAPSAVRPFGELFVNENYFGSQIYNEAYPGQQIADAYLGKYKSGTANEISIWLAQAANEYTGGTKTRSGGIDVNPESINHLAKQYFGSLYDMTTGTLDIGGEAYQRFVKGAPRSKFDWKDIPIAGQLGRRFVGENSRYADISSYYERKEYLKGLNTEFKLIQKGEEEFHFPKEVYGKAAALLKLSNEFDKKLKELRAIKIKVREKINKGEDTNEMFDRIEKIESSEDKLVDAFNKKFLTIFKRYSTLNKPVMVK